jgi:hypothetical protein
LLLALDEVDCLGNGVGCSEGGAGSAHSAEQNGSEQKRQGQGEEQFSYHVFWGGMRVNR